MVPHNVLPCRWLHDCLAKNVIGTMPMVTQEWMQPSDEGTMFPPNILERGITQWECEHCPWWIDYPIGVIPKQEHGLHKSEFLLYSWVLLYDKYFLSESLLMNIMCH